MNRSHECSFPILANGIFIGEGRCLDDDGDDDDDDDVVVVVVVDDDDDVEGEDNTEGEESEYETGKEREERSAE